MYYTPLKKYQGCIYESKKEQNKEEPTKNETKQEGGTKNRTAVFLHVPTRVVQM